MCNHEASCEMWNSQNKAFKTTEKKKGKFQIYTYNILEHGVWYISNST